MTRVKICGLKRFEDARVATEAGADLLGFVFAPSRRRIRPEVARDIVSRLKALRDVKAVGVFVNAEPDEMNAITKESRLDYVQLSGDEPDDVIDALDVPAIQVIHIRRYISPEVLGEKIEATTAELIMLDTAQDGQYGGTGRAFDWNRVPGLSRPVLLAGGLHPGNVGEAIGRIRPWGVDVSSGVEIDGEKDHGRIRDFINAARA